jgi:hypothetical protein
MFRLFGFIVGLALLVVVLWFVLLALVAVGIVWAGVKAGQMGWRWWQAQPSQQVKRARTRVLKPGEIDVRGF